MIFFVDKPPITWNHVRMLVHECRDNEAIARAAVDGIRNEFTFSIRRKVVVVNGKISFMVEVKKEPPIKETVIKGVIKVTTGSLKKAWRMMWP